MHEIKSKFKIFNAKLNAVNINTVRLSVLFKIILIALFLFPISHFPVLAQSENSLAYLFEIHVNENGSASGKTIISIHNPDQQDFITGYKFAMPIKNVNSIQAFADGKDLWFTTSDSGQYKYIDIDLLGHEIRSGESRSIEINWTSSSIIENMGSLKQIYIPRPFEENISQKVIYKIYYPKSFGKDIYVDLGEVNINESGNSYQFEVNISDGLYITWGSNHEFGIESMFRILNDSEEKKQTLFNIPNDIKSQAIEYIEITGTKSGFKDEYNNYYGYSEIDPKTEKEVSIKANVHLGKNTEKEFKNLPSYGFPFKQDSSSAVSWLKQLAQQDSSYNKVKLLNDLLVQESKLNSNEKVDPEVQNTIWTRVDTKANLNSFELCYILVSYAESIGATGRIDFGYIAYPFNTLFNNSNPHFWCEVSFGDKWILMDPYLEALLGIVYYDRTPRDRVFMGVWHPTLQSTNALGLIGTSDPVALNISAAYADIEEDTSTLGIDLPGNVISGNYYSGEMRYYNLSKKIKTPVNILIDGWDYSDQLKINTTFQIVFLPQTSNTKDINYIREPSFFYDGKKELKTEIMFDNDEKSSTTNIVAFEPNKIFFIFLLSITIVLMLVCIGILFKVIFAKRKRIILT